MELYRAYILELSKHPRNKKVLEQFDAECSARNASCGDAIMIQICGRNRVEDIGYQGEGCAISQAAVSLLTDWAKGKTIEEVGLLSAEEAVAMLGVEISYARMNCALLGKKALQGAIKKL